MTLLVFSWAIREHRPRSVNPQFWMLLGLCAIANPAVISKGDEGTRRRA